MKHLLVALLIAICTYPVAKAHDATTPERELAAAVGRVDLKRGITFVQANAIARFYFQHHVSGCGGADRAVDRGSRWEVTPRIGVAGTPSKDPIVIDKHTGQIFRRNGPTFNLVALITSNEVLPQPIHTAAITWPTNLPGDARSTTIQVEFVVLPSGATSDVRFEHSSGRPVCDRAVREAVERWQYIPRKTPATLVESIETCTY